MSQARIKRDIRARNLDIVLTAVSRDGLCTRNAIAEAAGLHKSSVTSPVGELTRLGVLREHPPQHHSAAGRPAGLIDVVPSAAVGLGLEIRADSSIACVADLAGKERYGAAVYGVNRIRQPESVLGELAAVAADAMREIERRQLLLTGLTIAVPGGIDATGRVVVEAPDLGWSDVPALDIFRERLGLPEVSVTLGETRSLAALAELYDPNGAGLAQCLYVTGDGGVSARVLVGGEIVGSPHGVADAFGHIAVEAEGPRCECGRRGCLEAR